MASHFTSRPVPSHRSHSAPGSQRVSHMGVLWSRLIHLPPMEEKIFLYQPRGLLSQRQENESHVDALSPKRGPAEPEGGLRQMQRKQVLGSELKLVLFKKKRMISLNLRLCFQLPHVHTCMATGHFRLIIDLLGSVAIFVTLRPAPFNKFT